MLQIRPPSIDSFRKKEFGYTMLRIWIYNAKVAVAVSNPEPKPLYESAGISDKIFPKVQKQTLVSVSIVEIRPVYPDQE